jgi:hypothetical protein
MNWRFCVTASHRAAIANKETNRIGALSSLFFPFSSFFFLPFSLFFFSRFFLSPPTFRVRACFRSLDSTRSATRDKANGVDMYYWVRDIQGYIYIFRECICSYPTRGPKSILPHELSPLVAVVASPSCMNRRAIRRGTFAAGETASLFPERTLEKSMRHFKLRFYPLALRQVSRGALEIFMPLIPARSVSCCRNTRFHFYSREYSHRGWTGRRTPCISDWILFACLCHIIGGLIEI